MTRSETNPPSELSSGDVVWVALDPTKGREQSGHRPAVVVSSNDYLDAATTLAIVVPVTSRDRHWPNHVRLRGDTGLDPDSWAMTEQIRTISRDRVTSVAGRIDARCLTEIRQFLRDFLAF